MNDGTLKVWALAGRLGRYDARFPLSPWLDRLERRGCAPRALCISNGGASPADGRLVEVPGLGGRWLRCWAARSLRRDERLERPDLIHVVHDEMSEAALSVAESCGVPYVQTVASFRTIERGLRLSGRWCRGLIATGPELAAALVDDLGVPPERIALVPPGIARPRTPAPPERAETGPGFDADADADADAEGRYIDEAPSDRGGGDGGLARVPVVGTDGPLDDGAGLAVFLRAARRVIDADWDVEFVIAGPGADHQDLRRRAQQLRIGDRVTVAEFPSVGAEYWSVLDIYCQPSIVPNAGATLLQAMAHAVPCVATNVDGLRGLLEPGRTGLIVPPDDPEALEAAVIDLLERPEKARRLGLDALEHVRAHYDADAEADRLAEIYRRAASAKGQFPDFSTL